MTGLVTAEVPVATVIPVATAFGVAFLSRPVNGLRLLSTFWSSDACQSGRRARLTCRVVAAPREGAFLVAVGAAVAIRFVSRCPALSHSGGQRLKALAGFPFPFLSLSPFPPPLQGGKLSPLRRLELGGVGGSCGATWTPTLTPASSDMDANFSGLHAQQSCKLLKQGMATIGGMSPNGSLVVKSVW
ncbi:hypothetical protein Taro_003756 [Colocasia esculenta]|uniref:Uncharacterized protein n=1 Tax=Colocasia esculenta TaxID=4460 RepID=A0A843TSS8_COLES|nr:hypothetical protein [Colocasia esculenta]